MNRPSLKHLIIICSFILSILIIILAIQFRNESKFKKFYTELYDVDKNIDSSFYNQARSLLKSVYNGIYNRRTALIFLKRVEKLSAATDNYSGLVEYASMLNNRFSGSLEINVIYDYALQKSGKYEKALALSEKKLKDSTYYKFHILNYILNNKDIKTFNIDGKYREEYEFLFAGDNIKREMLYDAFKHFNDERFIIDAMLLTAITEGVDEAYSILPEISDDECMEVKALIAYDHKDFKKALHFYEKVNTGFDNPDYYLTGCDIYIRNGNFDTAVAMYKNFLSNFPGKYSLPYRNLYSLNIDNSTGKKWLSEGLTLFPYDTLLLVPYAWELQLGNDYAGLQHVMEYFNSNDPSCELFRLNTMLNSRSTEHLISNFWNVYNLEPGSEDIAVSFANVLLENRQFEQLKKLLSDYSGLYGKNGWVDTYLAVANALQGNYTGALEYINYALIENDDMINNYNKAVILMLNNDFSGAEKLFKKALFFAEQDENELDVENFSKIYLKLAEENYNIGDMDDAEFYIVLLMDLDPDNMKGSLLKNRI